MPIHSEVLKAAVRLCRRRGGWSFSPGEVVLLLPHLNASSIRTHIVSRCCVNAPKNHPHKWDYFRRIGRGLYEILPAVRKVDSRAPDGAKREASRLRSTAVSEGAEPYGRRRTPLRDTIHAAVVRDQDSYVAECLEIAVVSHGRSLDELVSNLQEAISLHLEGEDRTALGLTETPRLALSYELTAL